MTSVTDWVQAIAVVVASAVAAYSVNAWRREMVGRRRVEVAEAALSDFYEARDHLEWARTPVGIEDAGRTRRPIEGETPEEAGYRDAMYSSIERLHARTEFFARFEASKYRFMAIFGPDAGGSFEAVVAARNRVIHSAEQMIRQNIRETHRTWINRREADKQTEEERRWEMDIGWRLGGPGEDQIALMVNNAISAVEAICRPVIMGRQTRDWWARVRRSLAA